VANSKRTRTVNSFAIVVFELGPLPLPDRWRNAYFLIYLAGAGFYLFVTPASIFVLMNEHSRWIQALEAAALLLCTAVSILLLAGAGVLKLVKSMQDRV
jgi:uncharacterized membrane protein